MLHASRCRNNGLARIFHDLGLMEREGSGFDLIYDRLLSPGMRYFDAPGWLRGARLDRKTTLSRITPHRLLALILEDLARHPDSSSADINRRIGVEISAKTVKRVLDDLVLRGQVVYAGERHWRRYRLSNREHKGHNLDLSFMKRRFV